MTANASDPALARAWLAAIAEHRDRNAFADLCRQFMPGPPTPPQFAKIPPIRAAFALLSYLTGVASAGEVNGDGRADLLIGASGHDENDDGYPSSGEGKTHLILNPF